MKGGYAREPALNFGRFLAPEGLEPKDTTSATPCLTY